VTLFQHEVFCIQSEKKWESVENSGLRWEEKYLVLPTSPSTNQTPHIVHIIYIALVH